MSHHSPKFATSENERRNVWQYAYAQVGWRQQAGLGGLAGNEFIEIALFGTKDEEQRHLRGFGHKMAAEKDRTGQTASRCLGQPTCCASIDRPAPQCKKEGGLVQKLFPRE